MAASAVLALPLVAAADPVVLRNGSYLEGEASVRQGATVLSNFYATWDDTFLPEIGVGSFSDGLTLAAGVVVLSPASHLTTNISSTTFSAVGGGTSAAIQVSSLLDPASRLSAFAISQLVIEFTLDEAHLFTYTGRYVGSAVHVSSDSAVGHAMSGTLYRVIDIGPNATATILDFNDFLFSTLLGEEATTYSGTLEPGR